MEHTYSYGYMDSPLGLLELKADSTGLASISFVENRDTCEENASQIIEEAKYELREYFEGRLKKFCVPLNPLGTHFQLNVWEELLKIPYARTISYEALARRLGDVKVIRAAASANGKNPLPVIIPCHRVIGKAGNLTGYSGGLWRKKILIEIEQQRVQLPMFTY